MFRILNLEFRYYLGFRILILGFIAACLGFVAFIPNAEAAIVIQAPKYIGLNSGLVGYWSFDGKDMANVTAYDRSGNANNGTLTNGPTRAFGKIGQGLSFDGSNDYVNVSDNANFDLGGKNFSISFWFKANEDLNTIGDIWSDRRSILQKGVDSIGLAKGADQIFFEGDVDTALIEFSNGANWFNAQTAKTSWDANTWYHGVITHNQTTMSWYIDGILDSQTTRTETIQNNNDSLRIGRFDRNAWSWTGLIDDVRIYNRALSADEIKRLYRIGATLKINTSINNDSLANGLVGYWSMNAPDVAGTTAYDRSGQGKNGTFTGVDGSTDTIAVDGTPSTATFTTGNPINVSHTTGSGANFMLVGISITNDNFGSISSVTYNGDALTQACENQSDDDANVYIYYRVNPDITTANVTVTLSTGAASGGVIGVMTFSGVNTTTPLGTCADSGIDEGTTINVDVTSATGELVFDVISTEDGNPTANASQTVRWDISANPVYAG